MEERSIYGLKQVLDFSHTHLRSKLSRLLHSGRLHSQLRGRYDRVLNRERLVYVVLSCYARGIYELTSLNKTQVLVAYLQGILRRDLAPKTPPGGC